MNKQQNAKIASTYLHYANKVWNPVEWYKDYTGQNKPEKDDNLTGIGRVGVGMLLAALTGGVAAKALGIPLTAKLGLPAVGSSIGKFSGNIGKLISRLRGAKVPMTTPGAATNIPTTASQGKLGKLISLLLTGKSTGATTGKTVASTATGKVPINAGPANVGGIKIPVSGPGASNATTNATQSAFDRFSKPLLDKQINMPAAAKATQTAAKAAPSGVRGSTHVGIRSGNSVSNIKAQSGPGIQSNRVGPALTPEQTAAEKILAGARSIFPRGTQPF